MSIFDLFRKKESDVSSLLYTEEELEQYENYLTSQFGECSEVFHELVSLDIHLDVLIFPPTEKDNYYKLVTMGMGAYKMKLPRKLSHLGLERAELIICLPPDWNIKSSDNKDYWPIGTMKSIARVPINYNTWVGRGHTISSDKKNTPYADNTKLCVSLLLDPADLNLKPMDFRLSNGEKINFYQLFPIYEGELFYTMTNGVDELLESFDSETLSPALNINRKEYHKL